MKARVVSFARGARWFGYGWRLFIAAPAGWLALVFGYWLLMAALSLVPYAGILAASVCVPAFSVGFMAAARAVAQGERPALGLLFSALRTRPAPQLVLGIVYTLLLAAVFGLSALADDGALARALLFGERAEDAAGTPAPLFGALLVAMAAYAPVMLMFWFAPVLVAWHDCTPGRALFYSFFACLMNWRAFLGYALVTAVATLIAPWLAGHAAALLAEEARKQIAFVLFPVLLVLLPTMLASFYASYRDVFDDPARLENGRA